jgi:diphthine synthase
MGRLSFVGLGLGPRGISLEGLDEVKEAEIAYLEYYTTPHEPALISEIEKASGREVTVVDRGFVEDGKRLLQEAQHKRVALLVPGDPMVATTHTELRARAIAAGIETRLIHAATIGTAAASASGLHFYKFSRTVTVTRDSVDRVSQAYLILHGNLLEGAHSLVLLEYDVESGQGVTPQAAISGLLSAEQNYKRGVVGDKTFALVLSRLGRPDQELRAGELTALRQSDYGAPPHCLVIPGKLHFTEEEAVGAIFSLGRGRVHGNSESVRRTAQTLVPKYVGKTRRGLESVKGKLGPEYDAVLENVELYMKDAENFLANNEDELAMLSIGYAEGLLDSLNFAGVVKIDW